MEAILQKPLHIQSAPSPSSSPWSLILYRVPSTSLKYEEAGKVYSSA